MKTRRLLFSYFALCVGLFAQTTGTLTGKVRAADGSSVPSASVMVVDQSGQRHNTVTGQDGSFSVANLPSGTYRVEVEVPGYKRLTQSDVQITAGAPINLQLGMETGSNNDVVEVQGQAPLADDQNSRIAHSYAGRMLFNLPVQDLNHQQLVELMPGITPPAPTASLLTDPQRNRTWNTNGQPAQANNTLLDGVENLEAYRGTEVHVPAIGGIQQMNLTTSNYDASQGRAGGSILTPITRAGSNSPHGDLFEYFSNDWLRARNYFDPKGLAQPHYVQNQFGGAIGGAIIPDKTFFFLSEQSDTLRDANSNFTTVPNAAFRAGNFSGLPNVTIWNPFTGSANGVGRVAFPGNQIPVNLLNPRSLALLNSIPQANLSGVENNYFSNSPIRNDGNRVDARVDHRFNENNLFFMRYGLSYYTTSQDSPLGAIGGAGGSSRLRAHDALAGFTHDFGPTTVTDLRLGYTRYSDPIVAAAGVNGLPYIQIGGMDAIGSNPSYPQLNKEDTWNIVNNWNMRIRNSDLRFGIDLWQVRVDGFQNQLYGPQGGYTFSAGATGTPGADIGRYGNFANSFAAFLLGTPTLAGVTSNTFVPSYISRQYGGYVADRITLMSKLTLDIGLRYDYFNPIEPRNNAANYSIFNPNSDTLVPIAQNGIDRRGNLSADKFNLAPRIGIAYRFNDRTTIRTGYGMSYWNGALNFASSTLIPSFNSVQAGVAGGYGVAGTFGTLPTASTTGALAPNNAFYFSNQFRTPYVQFFNFDVQRDMTHGILLDIAYVGNLGRELPFTRDMNAALPGSGASGQPFYSFGRTAPTYLRGSGFTSNYNSLQVNATKRFSQGIGFTAAYTYSKALDYGAGLTPFLNNNNPTSNYGPANFNRGQVFTLAHTWRLPFGTGTRYMSNGMLGRILGPWELDGIFRHATGLPFTPTASAAACACTGNTPTADVVPGPTVSGLSYVPSYYGYFYYAVPYQFQTQSLAQPAAGTLGNVGRNSMWGPSFSNYDMALMRSFVFVEQTSLQFRAEAYNISNTPHFGAPITNVNSANFGLSTATAPGLGERTLQFALKLIF